jgi:hypothetical protein
LIVDFLPLELLGVVFSKGLQKGGTLTTEILFSWLAIASLA